MTKYLFDFGRLFAGILAAKAVIALGYDIASGIIVAAAVPIIAEPLKTRLFRPAEPPR